MNEMTGVVEQQLQQQQQQYVSGGVSANEKLYCKDCNMHFDSSNSMEVHLRYHHNNLLNQWTSQPNQQEESNNNNSKAGNHNSSGPAGGGHVSNLSIKHESVTAPADSSDTSSRPPSEGPTSSTTNFQQEQHRQQHQHHQQSYNHFSAPIFNETSYFLHNEPSYILPHHFSPNRQQEDDDQHQRGQTGSNYTRYHPYQHPQHFAAEQRTSSVSSTSPRSSLQCDKCGTIYENANQLTEHIRTSHPPSSPNDSSYPSQQPSAQLPQSQQPPQQPTQYQQLAGSPQQVAQSQQSQAQTQQKQIITSPSQSNQHQQQQVSQQQPNYDYAGGSVIKNEPIKQEPEEQAEILDLDSHKVQTHRYEEEYMRLQQQQNQEMHIQMQQQVIQHQPRGTTHSVSSMLSWSSSSQSQDYSHPGLSPMGPMDSVSSLQEQQNQFIRSQQHLSSIEPPRHPSSPIITSTQSIPGLPLTTGLIQQNPKPPPLGGNQSWKSNEARRPKTYNCTACNKWFTSSGHLKRHYNTTLHKNAVKQSNQPDPANMPISVHHHPGRDNNSGRTSAVSRNSPDLSTSSSPPNLMAGPSGEATRGLLHTPTTTPAIFSNNNSSSSNSNEATPAQSALGQNALLHQTQQQSQAQQPQQAPQPSTVMLASNLVFLGSPRSSPMAQSQQQHSLHMQQMGSPSPQLGQSHQQQDHPIHHLPMDSPSQIGASAHHPMNSPMSPMQQHQVHMSSPSPMASVHHHMSSPSPIMAGAIPAVMPSPPPGLMGGTTMPHQPYPNALPPHVTTTTSLPGLLESITSQLTTTGNSDMHSMSTTQEQHPQQQEMLPGFGTFSTHSQQKMLPSFTQLSNIANGFLVGRNQSEAVNVGGLSPEENITPQERTFDSSISSYDIYRNSSPRYECLSGMEMVHSSDGPIIVSTYSEHQRHYQLQQPHHEEQQVISSDQQQQQQSPRETNNNLLQLPAKEELNPNILSKEITIDDEKKCNKVTKEHQVTSTNTGSHYISQNGLHKCIECDKVFNKACYLTQHNKSFHSGDKPFKCNQCGKRFPHEYLHAEHLQKHAGDKPYKCEICPKQFNHKTDLRRHMCLHTGEKPYACQTCGKGFIRKDHMMKHVETHKKKSNNYHKVHLRA